MNNIIISKEKLRKIDSAARRQALIEEGLYAIPRHKVHKSKKTYNRKKKHKGMYDE